MTTSTHSTGKHIYRTLAEYAHRSGVRFTTTNTIVPEYGVVQILDYDFARFGVSTNPLPERFIENVLADQQLLDLAEEVTAIKTDDGKVFGLRFIYPTEARVTYENVK